MTNQAPLTNEQKVMQVKGILMQNLNQFYAQLINFVRQTPIDERLKDLSIQNLDQGVMWFEQGVKKLDFLVENPTEEPTNESQNASQENESQSPCQESKESEVAA